VECPDPPEPEPLMKADGGRVGEGDASDDPFDVLVLNRTEKCHIEAGPYPAPFVSGATVDRRFDGGRVRGSRTERAARCPAHQQAPRIGGDPKAVSSAGEMLVEPAGALRRMDEGDLERRGTPLDVVIVDVQDGWEVRVTTRPNGDGYRDHGDPSRSASRYHRAPIWKVDEGPAQRPND